VGVETRVSPQSVATRWILSLAVKKIPAAGVFRDLAAIFGVTTKRFNEQVIGNAARFPTISCFRFHTTKRPFF
jgi:hypothetical protein